MAQKILIAVDDSDNAQRAVAFVAKTFSTDNNVTLINVMMDTASLCDMDSPELTPLFKTHQTSFCSLEDKKRELVKEAMGKAREILLEAGFSSENVITKIEDKRRGVARDILTEAEKGYDLVVIGRRGLSSIREFFLGSVSQKVFHGAKNISVLVVN